MTQYGVLGLTELTNFMACYSMLAFKVNAVGVELPTDGPEKALLQKQSFSLLGRCLWTKQGAGHFFLQPVDAEPGHQLYDVAEPKWVTADNEDHGAE